MQREQTSLRSTVPGAFWRTASLATPVQTTAPWALSPQAQGSLGMQQPAHLLTVGQFGPWAHTQTKSRAETRFRQAHGFGRLFRIQKALQMSMGLTGLPKFRSLNSRRVCIPPAVFKLRSAALSAPGPEGLPGVPGGPQGWFQGWKVKGGEAKRAGRWGSLLCHPNNCLGAGSTRRASGPSFV